MSRMYHFLYSTWVTSKFKVMQNVKFSYEVAKRWRYYVGTFFKSYMNMLRRTVLKLKQRYFQYIHHLQQQRGAV